MMSGMGRKLSGRTVFFAVLCCLAGVAGGVLMLWANFCLWTCDLYQRTAFDWGLGLTAVSFGVLVASLVLAVKAIRRRDGRGWAVAALCLAGAPVLYGLIGVPLAYFAIGF